MAEGSTTAGTVFAMRRLAEEGVTFQSPVNGDTVILTPERSIEVQHDLNSDVTMIFDECTPYPASETEVRKSMELSLRWAERSRRTFDRLKSGNSDAALFGIVQGGIHHDLRRRSLDGLTEIGFEGYAVGGLAVGEPESERLEVLDELGVKDEPLLKLAMGLAKIALEDPYFVERKLYPNVDFYSCIILRAMGFPTSMFTVIFALARTVGWVAQWNEMIEDPSQKIGRPRQLYTGAAHRPYVPLHQR